MLKGAIEEVARLKNQENTIIQLVRVDEIVPIAPKPTITVTMQELSKDAKGGSRIEFFAEGHSEAGIEFYAWDFNYDEEQGFVPAVILNKSGTQEYTFDEEILANYLPNQQECNSFSAIFRLIVRIIAVLKSALKWTKCGAFTMTKTISFGYDGRSIMTRAW